MAELSAQDGGLENSHHHQWITRLERLEALIVVLFAATLPLGLTVPYAVMIVGIVASVLATIVESVVLKRKGLLQSAPGIFDAPLALPLASLFFAVALSGLLVGGLGEALKSVEMLRAFVVYFWAYYVFAKKPNLVFRSCEWLLAVGALSGLWGTIQQLFAFHPFSYPYLQGTGFQGGPMPFAGQMEVLSMLALALLLKAKQGKGQFSAWFLKVPVFQMIVAGNILGVIFASERSAWLGVTLAAVAISMIVSLRTSLAVIACVLVAGAIGWFSIPVFQKRLVPLTDPAHDVGARVRFHVWDVAVKEFQKSPITGVGFRKFPLLDIPEAIVPGRSKFLDHAHNNYLHFLSTTGVIGLACFLWLNWSMLVVAWRRYAGQGDDCAIALGVLGATISLIVAGLFEYNFGTPQVRLTLWFSLAMLARGGASQSKSDLHPALGVESPGGEQAHENN